VVVTRLGPSMGHGSRNDTVQILLSCRDWHGPWCLNHAWTDRKDSGGSLKPGEARNNSPANASERQTGLLR
jgi:hypothetical protein